MKTEITWTDRAWERYNAVLGDIAAHRAYYGDQWADALAANFYSTLARVTMAAGPVNIYTDGTDSFLIVSEYITIGMIWFPHDDEQRKGTLAQYGFHYDNENTAGWPDTGTWSTHS